MERQFNYTLDFQYKIVSISLRFEESFKNFNGIIHPNYFTNKILQTAWKFLSKYYVMEGVLLTLDTLIVMLQNINKFSEEELDTFKQKVLEQDIRDSEIVVKEVAKFCKTSAYLMAIDSSLNQITQGVYDDFVVKLAEISEKNFEDVDLGLDLFEGYLDCLLQNKVDMLERKVLPSGLFIDGFSGGGLGIGEIGCVFGPSGRGKSALLANIAFHALLHSANVVYVTCELPKESVADRFSKLIMATNHKARNYTKADLISVLTRLSNDTKSNLTIKEYPSGDLNVSTLYSYIKNLEAIKKRKTDLIVVDYLGEMALPNADREDLKYKHLTTQLRGMSKRLESRVWTAHQTKGGTEKKEVVKQGDISDSSGIFKVLDLGVTIGGTEIEFKSGFTRLCQIKNRFGPPLQQCIYKFVGESFMFAQSNFAELSQSVMMAKEKQQMEEFD